MTRGFTEMLHVRVSFLRAEQSKEKDPRERGHMAVSELGRAQR